MNSMPNWKATEPYVVLIVRADQPAQPYKQIARAVYRQFARADEQYVRISRYSPTPEATEPDNALIARGDERLAQAQIAQTDEQLAGATERISRLEHDADDAGRRRSAVPDRPSGGRPVLRGLTGLAFAACIFGAAFVSHSSYGDTARQIVARWAPQLVLTSSLPAKTPELAAPPGSSATEIVAATPAQPVPSAGTAPQAVAPAAPPSPELGQMLQAMARDLANLEQGIAQLKTNLEQMAGDNANAIEQIKATQAQMARDNAKAADELKASQEQMASYIARVSEQSPQPRRFAPTSSNASPTR